MASGFEQPDIDFLILGDRVEAVNGKLYMMGGAWDRLNVVDFNQPVPFGFAVGILIPWNDANEALPLTITISGEDGEKITPDLQTTVSVGRPPNAVKGQSFRAVIAVQGTWKLPKPGTYVVRASLTDGRKEVRFYAVPIAHPQ